MTTTSPGEHLPGIFLDSCAANPEGTAATTYEGGVWRDHSWAQLEARVRSLAMGLLALGLLPGDRVGLLGPTTLCWVECELAAHFVGAVCVPIYHTLPFDDACYIAADAGVRLCFVADRSAAAPFVESRASVPSLERVILMEGEGEGDRLLDLVQLNRLGAAQATALGEGLETRLKALEPASPAHFIYTSGTTGPPKGVMLSHANWAFEAEAAATMEVARPGDQGLMFLPLAHSYAQVLKTIWFKLGQPVTFARGLTTVVEDMLVARPAVMATVPRILEKIYARVVSTGATKAGIRGSLFRWAMRTFEQEVERRRRHARRFSPSWQLAKRLVFPKIGAILQQRFGGRLRFLISGGAPLSFQIACFFHFAGIEVLEGYGLTETSAATTVNRPGKVRLGSVGPPLPGVSLKIASSDGEILVRGPGVMLGYHGRPEETAKVLDTEGWFHTGDLGRVEEDGTLFITGRKKDLIVTAGGKNIAPQKLENRLKAQRLISQVLVHGDRRNYLTALITLDPEALEQTSLGRRAEERDEAAAAEVEEAVAVLNATLPSFETIKAYQILPQEFSEERGEMTPSMKLRRGQIEIRFAAILDGFYEEKY